MYIAFFPQNETHVANMALLAKKLMPYAKIEFYLAQEYFKQLIVPAEFPFEIKDIKRKIDGEAFYKVGAVEKIHITNSFKSELGDLSYLNVVVVANDGALQRAFLNRTTKARKILMLDGIITDYTFPVVSIFRNSKEKLTDLKDWLRRSLRNISFRFASLPIIGSYLPSEIGCYPFDCAFVVSNYVTEVLKRRHSPIRNYYAVGLPRYEPIFRQRTAFKCLNNSLSLDPIRILFISQGYLWHNEYQNDAMQHDTLLALLTYLEAQKSHLPTEITLRVHPRDEVGRYRHYPVKIQEPCVDLCEAIKHTDIVVGFSSTVLLESAWLGVPSCSLMLRGQAWRFSRSFLGKGAVPIISNLESFNEFMHAVKNKQLHVGQLQKKVEEVFNPFTTNTMNELVKIIRGQ